MADREYDTLIKEYRRLAKRADQRLVRLERLSTEKGFSNVKEWSYKKALKDIHDWSGEEAKRFNTKPPESIKDLRHKIRNIKEFLDSVTSTKSDIVNSYNKRVNTINEKYGTNFTWESLAKFFESESSERMEKMYGSDTMMQVIATIQNNEKKIIELIKDADNRIEIEADNKILQYDVNRALKDSGININDMFPIK